MNQSNTQRANLAIESSGAPSKLLYTIFAVSAILGISGWLLLLSVFIFWTLEPSTLPIIKEPIPVLNENHEVAINQPLFMEFEVTKLEDLVPISSARYLECMSGNLVTLTSTPINLPVGSYTITSSEVMIPAKIAAGDTCVFVIQATFEINPLKHETVRFGSESFLVLPVKEK